MSKYDDLVKKLKEVFQIDRPELDFGVYRILNARVEEINDYLENRLKAKVQESLSKQAEGDNAFRIKELTEKIREEFGKRVFDEQGRLADEQVKESELGRQLLHLQSAIPTAAEHENTVFTHLLTFFSRYYDSGDFISQRRYKGDTYALPYAGEEVVLHWANKDQYYTKSGENFSNYGFKLDDGRTVRLRLITADTAKDNRKDNDKERRFVLIEPHTRTLTDEEGDEYEETLLPVTEENGELVLRFEYKAMPKGSKQEDLVAKAVKTVLEDSNVKARWLDLAKREPTEKNPHRTLLEKCLASYTTKNTADYFIHKDLGGFLGRELDFYIKNEVMHLDDVQHADKFADIEKNLRLIQTLRTIALDLIDFLAQLENFQKKLWLKKKFVVSAHYCVTLDRIPENLYPAIADNSMQWEQWDQLGMLDGNKTDLFIQAKAGSIEFLQAHPYLMADTALFNADFKYDLLAGVDNLDESLDGLLIHGDNSAALDLLSSRYLASIDCIAIDPPYNTGSDGFTYKDSYKASSWLAQQAQLTPIAQRLLTEIGSFFAFCDENQVHTYGAMLFEVFGQNNLVETLIWNKRIPKNDKGIGNIHDFIYLFSNNLASRRLADKSYVMRKEELDEITGIVKKCKLAKNGISQTQKELKKFYKKQGYDRGITLYCELDQNYEIWGKINMSWPNAKTEGPRYEVINPITKLPVPVPKNGWRWKEDTFRLAEKNGPQYSLPDGSMVVGRIWYSPKPTVQPSSITYLKEVQTFLLRSIVSNKSDGSLVLENLGLGGLLDYPKSVSLLERLVFSVSEQSGNYLDYFAGSGTTGQAVINLNREDKGTRKYILVEQGEYFDTVTKPRIQKVVYSSDWKEGKAATHETGLSHSFKVLKIESYEDTLNNLQLRRTEAQQSLIENLPQSAQEDYLLRYLLDIESRGSLLSVEQFNRPFDNKLRLTVDSAGAYEERRIDLVETFNYLIGLRVKHIDMQQDKGFVSVIGWLPSGEKTLVLWRDVEKVDYEALNRLCDKLAINPADSEFEIVYINGDHNIPAVFTNLETDGGITKTLKIRQIEPEFLSLMFSAEGV